jgi:hypothetical protein
MSSVSVSHINFDNTGTVILRPAEKRECGLEARVEVQSLFSVNIFSGLLASLSALYTLLLNYRVGTYWMSSLLAGRTQRRKKVFHIVGLVFSIQILCGLSRNQLILKGFL